MDEDLRRQRRNLIAISFVLLVFDFANVTIGKVSVLGTELLVGNAKVLYSSAWLVWGYFFLRYYQFWLNSDSTRDIGHAIWSKVHQRVGKWTHRKGASLTTRPVSVTLNRQAGLDWTYTLYEQGDIKPGQHMVHNKEIGQGAVSRWFLARSYISAALLVALNTTYISNYILPFAVAIAAPIVSLSSRLTGWP